MGEFTKRKNGKVDVVPVLLSKKGQVAYGA
jgi:hypothetical protein